MKLLIAASIVGAVAVMLPPDALAQAHHAGLSEKYQHEYWKCVRHFNTREPCGRNIVNHGVKYRHRPARPATKHEKAKSVRQLRRLSSPVALAVPPKQPPAGIATAAPNSGLATCIIQSESGGNTQAVNGQYSGIAQWSAEAWARMGGTRYAPTPTGATYDEQVVVLTDGLARFGCADWCPYDPC